MGIPLNAAEDTQADVGRISDTLHTGLDPAAPMPLSFLLWVAPPEAPLSSFSQALLDKWTGEKQLKDDTATSGPVSPEGPLVWTGLCMEASICFPCWFINERTI